MALTIFYDSNCPLCTREMTHLVKSDKHGAIELEDLHDPELSQRYPELDLAKAKQILHGKREDGRWIYGLDVTYEAWSRVGKGCWIAPLRWRWVRPFSDSAYLWFAKNRYKLSALVSGQDDCQQCAAPEASPKKAGTERSRP